MIYITSTGRHYTHPFFTSVIGKTSPEKNFALLIICKTLETYLQEGHFLGDVLPEDLVPETFTVDNVNNDFAQCRNNLSLVTNYLSITEEINIVNNLVCQKSHVDIHGHCKNSSSVFIIIHTTQKY